jgi:asparagine synthase (glutamine-hydrolysing)
MCGIAGIFNTRQNMPPNREYLAAMTAALSHRGPDDQAIFTDGAMGLGFKRLSIVDVVNGNQPFFNADRSVMLICNGEIYNYKELRKELYAKGYSFNTHCDVEVIVNLYMEYGTALLHKLNGQFAFALYDKNRHLLFLARDQFGVCPLFYFELNGSLLFASEIKALLKHPLVRREVNLTGLDQMLSLPGNVSPETMFRDIYSMKPGHYMLVGNGEAVQQEYWDLNYPTLSEPLRRHPENYYEERLEELLLQAVEYRLNAEVPVGFYLSGGLDSSLIGALMKKKGNKNYASFSVVFPGDSEIDESYYQQLVAAHTQSIHHEVPFTNEELLRRLKTAVFYSETPLRETYNTCSLALSERVRDSGVKVILSGEGSDELLGGYFGYRFDVQRMMKNKVSSPVKQVEDILAGEVRERIWGDSSFFYEMDERELEETKRALYSANLNEQYQDFDCFRRQLVDKEKLYDRHPFNKRSYLDLKLRLADHLIADHCDRVNYANGIEGRYPFLDINVVEFIKTIPHDLKLNGVNEKYILKKIARKYLPHEICDRQKYGWIAPGSPELLRSNTDWVNDLLSYDRIKRQGYFDPDTIERIKTAYRKDGFKLHASYENDLLIVVLTFGIFLDLFELPSF